MLAERVPRAKSKVMSTKHTQVVMHYGFAMPYLNAQWVKVASAADCCGGEPMPSGGSSLRPVKRT